MISLLTRSRGLVDQILRQCARGNAVNARTSAFASSINGPSLGNLVANSSRVLSQAALGVGGLGLSKDRAERRSHVVGLRLGDLREEVASEVDPAPLMGHALEAAPQRLDQSRLLVGDDQLHPGQATLLERGHEPSPEHLVLAVTDVEAPL